MRQASTRRRGFSLIELLVVIMVITVIISIIVPALGYARASAKVTASRQLVGTVTQSIAAFELSERRTPGVFTPTEMGSQAAMQGGLSAMQNMILDMAGGWKSSLDAGDTPAEWRAANPTTLASKQIFVNPKMIGVGKGYFVPPAKSFVAQNGQSGGIKVDGMGAVLANGVEAIPELVDSFGTPILAWQVDPIGRQPVAQVSDFAREYAGPAANPTLSRFYWQSNQCLLASTRMGTKGIDHTTQSILGSAYAGRFTSMAGFLGNPSSPVDVTRPYRDIMPASARGSVIVHAAGADATFLGIKDRGGKLAGTAGSSANPQLFYGLNFKTVADQPHRDANNNVSTIDLASEFDDIISAAGSSN